MEGGQSSLTPEQRLRLADDHWRPECRRYYSKELREQGITTDHPNPALEDSDQENRDDHTNDQTNGRPNFSSIILKAVGGLDGGHHILPGVQNTLKRLSTTLENRFLAIPSLLQQVDVRVRRQNRRGSMSPALGPKPIPLIQ